MTPSFPELVDLARRGDKQFAAFTRSDCLDAARTYAEERRREILADHRHGASGGDVIHRLSDVADTLVAGIFYFALYHVPRRNALLKRVALCAQGGYGRRELNPCSDLDIGLVYRGRLGKGHRILNDYMVPFLWDLGYGNSLVVRSVKETVALARKDTKVFTTYLHSRLVTGSSDPYGELRLLLQELAVKDPSGAFDALNGRENGSELSSDLNDPFAPEPNVKEGAGGLRDYHCAMWLLTMTYGVTTLDEVASLELITTDERLNLAQSLDFVWRVRNELHFQSGKCEDRLTFAHQQRVAAALGYTDDRTGDISAFMKDYYSAARRIRRFLRMSARACRQEALPDAHESSEPDVQEFKVLRGELALGRPDSHWFEENPPRLMAVFWECARHGVPMSHATELLVTKNLHLVGDAFRSSELVRRFFLAICNRPYQAGFALRQAAQTGLLGLYLPEFAAIQDVIRYEDFHHYPVDEHTLRAIEALAAIDELEGPAGSFLKMAIEHLQDPYVLVLALLFHDLGKARGEEHTAEGVRLVHRIGERIALPEEDRERIAFLVEHHLLMTHIALYRDTDDIEIVEEFAETMKSDDRLRALFVLSYADLSAVGPNVWNDWKGALLLKLYLKAERLMSGDTPHVEERYWEHPKAAVVRKLLPASLASEVDSHVRAFGHRYFTAYTPRQIASHLECLAEAERTGFAMRVVEDEESGLVDVAVCTPDRPGLFTEIAGCFASQLMDIEKASLFTRADGMALDCFSAVNASGRQRLSEAQYSVIESMFRSVLLEKEPVEGYLKKSRTRVFALLHPAVPVQTSVHFDNGASRSYTVIDITTGDRMGLLYDIARTLSDAGIDVASARIVTDARRVRDAFYVTYQGSKITHEAMQSGVCEALKEAIHPRPALATKGGIV